MQKTNTNQNTQNQTTALSTFSFNSNSLRVVELEGEPWFVAKDVCEALDLKAQAGGSFGHHLRPLGVKDRHTLIKSKATFKTTNLFYGSLARIPLVSESGLYALVLRSRKPEAQAFRNRVTQEVLPSIRKTGAYVMGQEPVAQTGNRHNLILKAVFATKKCYKIDRCHG